MLLHSIIELSGCETYNKSKVRMWRKAATKGVALPGASGATLAVPFPEEKKDFFWLIFGIDLSRPVTLTTTSRRRVLAS